MSPLQASEGSIGNLFASADRQPQPTQSWYEVPDSIKALLQKAADTWEDTELSQTYINQALVQANYHLDVLVSAYRYFFYKHNDSLALQIANQVLQRVCTTEHFPATWDLLQPILRDRKEEPSIRLYLNAYSASGLILARLGELDQARTIATQIKSIDDRNEFGASVILNILDAPPDEDE